MKLLPRRIYRVSENPHSVILDPRTKCSILNNQSSG